jgi:ADP-heptose:LPS heptosyltransferase
MATVLITRFSALGDVAIAVPLVRAIASSYPDDRFLLLSQPFLSELFADMPSNLVFIPVDIKNKYKGLKGMVEVYKMLRSERIDVVCDLHAVHRTRVLDFLFSFSKPVYKVNKDRQARKRLVRRWLKKQVPLKPALERYKEVFSKAGFDVLDATLVCSLPPVGLHLESMETFYGKKEGIWLGIAPFARHEGKRYPLAQMEQVLDELTSRSYVKVFLFGGGPEETRIMHSWKQKYSSVVLPVKAGLGHELQLMNCLDGLLTMDSANMHLGALANTKVFSVWGATHPLAGFAPWNQPDSYRIQLDLRCRPCSVYGKKPCYRKDHACMTELTPDRVITFIDKNLLA